MIVQKSYFTTKTASGSCFCDRDEERAQLKRNIEKGEHTVIVAPRRYGKTSLACQALSELAVPHTRINLFCAVYATTISEKIVKGVSDLVRELLPFSTKALNFLQKCFKHVNLVLTANAVELQVNWSAPNADPAEQLMDVLLGLEKIAKHKNRRVVVFLDEFQDLLKADQSNQIQAAIREVAQHSEYVSFIFSGSSRNMLRQIFDDRNQPLYMLCQKINLQRIHQEELMLHIQKQAKKNWKKELSVVVVEKILLLTECHSYYVNVLCANLWDGVYISSISAVESAWHRCMIDQTHKLVADLEPLSAARLKILSTIAIAHEVVAPNGKLFLDRVQLPLGTVQKNMRYLLDHDFIYQDARTRAYKLVDPLLRHFMITNRFD